MPDRSIEYVPLDDVAAADRNPKQHAQPDIMASVRRFGFTVPLMHDERTDRLVAGHGRLDALRVMRDRWADWRARGPGGNPDDEDGRVPDGVRVEGGVWLVPVTRGWASTDDAHANAYLIADNRLTEKGGWDDRSLAELLEEAKDHSDAMLASTGFTADDLDTLLASFDGTEADTELAGARESGGAPNPRKLTFDAIFTVHPAHVGAFIAHECGLKIGTQSSDTQALRNRDRWEWRFPLTFIDNEWHDYDHGKHVEFVAAFKPKYATVRDVMTKAQCEAAGVAYYTLDEILGMAADVAGHAENVMVIPKYDCIADIPEEFMLGYSVKSSYGSTPLPSWKFEGRRVHLLGGSWADQRRYMTLLGESVVSLDFNHCFNIARFGNFTMPDGTSQRLTEDHGLRPSNGATVSLALSLGNIGKAVHEISQGQAGTDNASYDTGDGATAARGREEETVTE